MKYRKKPVVVEAFQWLGDDNNQEDLKSLWEFCPTAAWVGVSIFARLVIPTLEGEMRCDHGDWIIKGVQGEFYPCKPEIFELTYEPA